MLFFVFTVLVKSDKRAFFGPSKHSKWVNLETLIRSLDFRVRRRDLNDLRHYSSTPHMVL